MAEVGTEGAAVGGAEIDHRLLPRKARTVGRATRWERRHLAGKRLGWHRENRRQDAGAPSGRVPGSADYYFVAFRNASRSASSWRVSCSSRPAGITLTEPGRISVMSVRAMR